MNRHSTVTHITPLPSSHVSRESVLALLHDHSAIITLNPLVTHHARCAPPSHALPDELDSAWYEITDRIEYVPGTGLTVDVTYTACMHDIPNGLQTHVHAPAGLEMRGKWQLLGWLPGEERSAFEIGAEQHQIPKEGLYLREDCEMKCNVLLTPFVKRNIQKSHKLLVEKLVERAGHLTLRQSLHIVSSQSNLRQLSTGSSSESASKWSHHQEHVDCLETPDNASQKFNEQRQRAALQWQANSYSVSVTGGKQRERAAASQPSLIDHNSASLTRRGRSQSPAYSLVKTSLGSSKRCPSEGASRRRNESPASFPSSASSRGASRARSSSWRKRMGRDTTPDIGEMAS
ncbi:hypothetical protein UA08_01836 [Talaromyces atroroseus]|uniref:DUF7053 domain-containing protein n=1 Tax=Talaromyces atroroseus TaxID=1441469 RepID=A0A1Q5QAB0_TALAT|nr:hypothetical protein UA08_01836 [Talaromyces atroroseus]OKL62872.1 hypothetical protein UA08_01836 [Talaromyces atroroseus]